MMACNNRRHMASNGNPSSEKQVTLPILSLRLTGKGPILPEEMPPEWKIPNVRNVSAKKQLLGGRKENLSFFEKASLAPMDSNGRTHLHQGGRYYYNSISVVAYRKLEETEDNSCKGGTPEISCKGGGWRVAFP